MPATRAPARRAWKVTFHAREILKIWRDGGQAGQALVETALVLPLLLVLALGIVGTSRAVQAQLGVSAVAREAARGAALADSPGEAIARGVQRGHSTAAGYSLGNGSLRVAVEPGALARGSVVQASASYIVGLDDLPLLGWVELRVSSAHAERVDPYRSRWGGGP